MYHGGRVRNVSDTEVGVEIFEASIRRTIICARSLATNAVVDDPVCVRITGAGIADYAIAEVIPSHFANTADAMSPLGLGVIPDAVRYA